MKMAKASEADLNMAMELTSMLDALGHRHCPSMPTVIARNDGDEDFDLDDAEQCARALRALLETAERGSLLRVVWGCAVMLDPKNQCVDPDADTIEHHPSTKAAMAAKKARPLDEWTEDMSDVLWWRFPIEEEPYVGHPNCSNWPGYHTHWTPLIVPDAPGAAPGAAAPKEQPPNDRPSGLVVETAHDEHGTFIGWRLTLPSDTLLAWADQSGPMAGFRVAGPDGGFIPRLHGRIDYSPANFGEQPNADITGRRSGA